jgi:lipopolysaccharide transport system ATP-binding protein
MPAIRISNLSKSYTIAHDRQRASNLGEAVMQKLRNPFQRSTTETFWALKDIDLEIEQGDVVGIIGRNGAGKSTLLKILSRITEPTTGRIELYGRVGALLEVGTGFHPELTGRENIFLNGAILGMRRPEIRKQFDAIVDFAGVEKFLDTPVKRYSSGMYVRLAFAVAAHLNPEILIVDEVLAVGDAEFQRKCLGKMKDVANSGRTVLFVSHHMQSVKVLCNRGMYLERGRVAQVGSVDNAIDLYVDSFSRPTVTHQDPDRRPGSGEYRFTHATPIRESFESNKEKCIRFTVERQRPGPGRIFISCLIFNEVGACILHCDSRMVEHWIEIEDRYDGEFMMRTPWLKPGDYRVDFFLCNNGIIDEWENACQISILPLLPYPASANNEATSNGTVFADFGYSRVVSSTPQEVQ